MWEGVEREEERVRKSGLGNPQNGGGRNSGVSAGDGK